MKNKTLFMAVAMLVMMALSLFGGGGQQGSGGSASASGKVEIRASWWGDTVRHELYSKIIGEFEKANPGITVVREPLTWAGYWDKMSVQAAGGNAPDFISMHPLYANDYIPRGVCEPLDDYIKNGTISVDNWAQSTIDTGKFNGKIYMMAMGITFVSSFVNLGAFKELGIEPPPFDWTLEDAKRIGLQVRQAFDKQGKRNQWMMADRTMDINAGVLRYYAREAGRDFYDREGKLAFTQQDLENLFTDYKELRDLGVIPDAATSMEYFELPLEDTLLARDKVLIHSDPVNKFWLYNTTFPDKELGIIRIPSRKNKIQSGEYPEGAHYAVYARSTPEKKLAAAKLINFWLNDPRSLILYRLDQGVPANEKVLQETVVPALDKFMQASVNFVNILAKVTTPSPNPPTGHSQITQEYLKAAQEVAYGVKTPAQAAKDFYELAQDILVKVAK
ncbi:MAG: extracellular solute-binding protein [Treponema sp.]|jgi:multiple sugar transport system substrate-binding protein|nr:extracellular solute-binding protein [Treponema sp.]